MWIQIPELAPGASGCSHAGHHSLMSRDLQLSDALEILPKTQLAERPFPTFYPLYPQGRGGLDLFLFLAHEGVNLNLTSRRML